MKKARNAKGISRAQLSILSDISESYIVKIESGQPWVVSFEKLKSLSRSLGIDYFDLLTAVGAFDDIPIDSEKLNKISNSLDGEMKEVINLLAMAEVQRFLIALKNMPKEKRDKILMAITSIVEAV